MARRKSSGWLQNAAHAARRAQARSKPSLALGGLNLTRRTKTGVLGVLVALAIAVSACGGSSPTPAGSQTVNATGGLVTAIAAGAVWAAGGGCRMQGCPYGSFCNRKTGFCEVRKCSEGCPEDTICNEGLGRCQGAPPPNTPNDFLPEDNALQRPPGS